jgi:hypothetical protein
MILKLKAIVRRFQEGTVRHALEQPPTSSCDDYGIFDFNWILSPSTVNLPYP